VLKLTQCYLAEWEHAGCRLLDESGHGLHRTKSSADDDEEKPRPDGPPPERSPDSAAAIADFERTLHFIGQLPPGHTVPAAAAAADTPECTDPDPSRRGEDSDEAKLRKGAAPCPPHARPPHTPHPHPIHGNSN
jgi:hypothetical protein